MDLDTIMCESLHSTERRNSSVEVGVAMRDYASCIVYGALQECG